MSNEMKNVTAARLRMLKNGYSPISNRDKVCYMPNWTKVTINEDAIKKWGRQSRNKATGVRVENGLCVIDIDVDHPIIEDLAEAMLDTLPEELRPDRLERHGKGHKFAWFCRTGDLFSRLHTRSWLAPGDKEDDGTHCIEIFGGGASRQFGVLGPHTLDDDGKATIYYRWVDEDISQVPLHQLDIISKDQLFTMLDVAEAELKRQGFEPVKRTKRGEGTPGREYDLTEDMLFDLLDGRTVSLAELQQMVKDGYSGNCSASWLDGRIAKNRHRCLVSKSSSGHVTVWESAAGITHMPAAIKPSDHSGLVDRIAGQVRERQEKQRAHLNEQDDHISGAAKLLVSYAFMPSARKSVVPLWSTSDDEGVTLQNFRTNMMPYCGVEIGPKGGEKKINPVDIWLSNPNRVSVAGLRMRPDRERPIFEEHDRIFLNTYRPPDLGVADGGAADGGIALLKQLVPDAREREWFCQWLAYKWKHPHIPGPSVIMVARDFGTGRGTFGALLKHLFGDRYVVNVPFKIFAGLSSQAQYTDWGINALVAIVNESSATGDVSAYRAKHDVYEHLKEVVEPRPSERLYIVKGETAVRSISSTSNLIMTNNVDAIPLPENDRRFAVLTNGNKRAPEFWEYINGWLEKQANIAAFAQWMEAIDLSSYDPYASPLMTAAKSEMADMNKTPLDMLLHDALDEMEGFFVTEQVLLKMAEAEMRTRLKLPNHWREIAKKALRSKAHACRNRVGRKIETQIEGQTFFPMHCNAKVATNCTVPTNVVRREIIKNGDAFGSNRLGSRLKSHLKTVNKD